MHCALLDHLTTPRHRSDILAWAIALLVCCRPVAAAPAADTLKIIPQPATVEPGQGAFIITSQTPIRTDAGSPPLKWLSTLLRDSIRTQTGLELKTNEVNAAAAPSGGIRLGLNAKPTDLGAEGYELVISPEQVLIRADQPAGAFYGIQTLLQMLSPALSAETSAAARKAIHLPSLRIVDRPRFAWRGLMLDCSRTFLAPEYLRNASTSAPPTS